ncbi:AGAP002939-PB [Anopheles gambiae str. PEST]|uniref:Mitochondrial 2-oxodicarboxylate carrier n=1 Tax=Anopheles gambiae TaxID=7165 RepID=Q5TU50_ANOGA|nr:mitochondrial 2-oxodicarboxylate carrier [Anopheles gambiae]XP_061503809.1 mitochondrial 2-oxodicarboxylate carrier [Anopheles gambiae]XP_563178.3 mitochondrial 2-oxodicarboxylate carrier [Anopheles gambiae]EAL40802.3 AGAP002939-PA [Anopheles gambiae str. PEST]EGK96695.1 AGAP002939-PB [Anopheles gambiae str. PEST]
MPSDLKEFLRQAAMQVGAGGSAGFVEVCIMHPLDLVKTRLQLQASPSAGAAKSTTYYNGVFDCIRKMARSEGVFSLYKGILPPVLVETPKRAVKFLTFEQYKRFFLFGSDKPTPLTFSLAGLGAGVTEAILVNPFEMVKVTLQANKNKMGQVPSTWAVTKQIIHESGFGLNGLNRGLTATIGRNGVFNMIYFGFYHSVKGIVPEYKDPVQEFLRKVGIGFVSGTLGSIVNIPFDVAKSRIQGPQPIPGQVKYRTTFGSMVIVAREEGFGALYKGLTPKVMRLGPGGAIMLVVYDYVYAFLDDYFK